MTNVKTEDGKKIFSTRDLYLAATLVTLHFPLLGIDHQIEGVKPRPIGYFNFEETPSLFEAKSHYNQGMILIEPRMFINNMQSLKADVVNFTYNPNSDYNQTK